MSKNFREKILSGFAWEVSTKLFVQILSWVSTILVARVLAPEDYGIVLISGLYTGLLTMLSSLGLSSGVVQKEIVSVSDASSLFWLTIFSGIIFYLALYFSSHFIAQIYDDQDLVTLLRVAGVVIILSSINIIPHAMMMRELRFRFEALVDMFSKFVLIASTLYMAYAGYGYWSLVISTLLSQLFVCLAYISAMKDKPLLHFNVSSSVDVIKFGFIILFSRILMWWNRSAAAVIASLTMSKVAAGHLQMASTLATIPLTKIGEIFDKITFPAIASIKGDVDQASKVFIEMHRYLLFITVPMFVGISVISEQIIYVFLGTQWAPIILPLQILCVANIVRVSNQLIPRVLEGMGNAKASAKFQFATAIVCPPFMLIGINFGLIGILGGWLLSLPIIYIYLYILAKRELTFSHSSFLSTILPPIYGGLVILSTSLLIDIFINHYSHGTILILKIVICTAAFALFNLLFFPKYFLDAASIVKRKGDV